MKTSKLKIIRQMLGLSQEEIGLIIGITQTNVAYRESCDCGLWADELAKLKKIGISILYMIGQGAHHFEDGVTLEMARVRANDEVDRKRKLNYEARGILK